MSRGSDLHPKVYEVGAEACEKFPDDEVMRRCAEFCRRCAASCRDMARVAA